MGFVGFAETVTFGVGGGGAGAGGGAVAACGGGGIGRGGGGAAPAGGASLVFTYPDVTGAKNSTPPALSGFESGFGFWAMP